VPGQYLAIDPKGRAVMIGAIEKQKLVYILNRDAQVIPFFDSSVLFLMFFIYESGPYITSKKLPVQQLRV
jgi:hypothetical protein